MISYVNVYTLIVCGMPVLVEDAKIPIVVSSVFGALGILSCLTAICFIVLSKSYHLYVYRLTLYVALFNLAFAVVLELEVLPVDTKKSDNATVVTIREGWNGACIFLGFADEYLNNARTLAVLWTSFYIFMLAVYNIELKRRRHEVAGVVTILLVSSLLPSIPFAFDLYGISDIWCWIKDSQNTNLSSTTIGIAVQLGIDIVPQLILSFVCVLLIGTVISIYNKGIHKDGALQHKRWIAIREMLPLLIYPSLYAIVIIADAANNIALIIANYEDIVVSTTVTVLLQVIQVSLPLSLLLHASVRRKLRERVQLLLFQTRNHYLPTHSQPATVGISQPSTVVSLSTHYIVSTGDDGDPSSPLIIRSGRH